MKARTPRRHVVIGDTQSKPGAPNDHMRWIARAILEYKPDVVVHVGDHWDHPSLNGYEKPGSVPLEGARYADDVAAGNASFADLSIPIEEKVAALKAGKRKLWTPELYYIMGNHDVRPDRIASNDAKLFGTIGSDRCDTRGWARIPFLKPINVDGIWYSHYFPNSHSGKPVGGEVSARFNKIGGSFVQGHEQGKREGNRLLTTGRTWYGLVLGSCYLHREEYRGNSGQRHWQGIAVLNDVSDGEYDLMTLSLRYLCRKYEGVELQTYMNAKYPNGDWEHLR
jgi:hypothetical protein